MKKSDKKTKALTVETNDSFTGIKQLPSGFYAVFVSGVWLDAASASRDQAEKKLKHFTND